MINNNTDNILINYANEEDKWNYYVDKTIDFNTNYSLFTSKKDVVDNNITTVDTNDNDLSNILKKIKNKKNEIIDIQKIIDKINYDISDAENKKNDIISKANDDFDLDTYDINDVGKNKFIGSYEILTTYRKETQQLMNDISQYSSYKNKSIDELNTMIKNAEDKNKIINSDITTAKNAIIKIDKNTNNKTYDKITDVPNDTNLYSKYNLYNGYISSLNTQRDLSNTKDTDKKSYQKKIDDDNSSLRQKTNLLNSKNAELTSKNKDLKKNENDLDNKTKEKSSNTTNYDLQKKEYDALNCSSVKNKDNCKERRGKLEKLMSSLTSSNTMLSNEITRLKNTTIPQVKREISTLTSEISTRTSEINTLNGNISRNNVLLSSTNNSITQINTTISTLTNNISSVKNSITTIQNEKTASIAPIQNEINTYKNSRFYNRCYIRLNKIIDYINQYNQYDIVALIKKRTVQEDILANKNNELNGLVTQKNNKITELNNNMKTCKTNKDDLNSRLSELRKDANVCKDVDMCTNKCAKNILCKVNDMFCSNESWYSIIKKQYLEYIYDVSCSNIDNKTEQGITEPFMNKMDMNKMDMNKMDMNKMDMNKMDINKMKEGFQQIYINPNIDADISYTNYYSKFINNKLNLEDVSQNMLNLKRNIEIDTYFYLKYNAQIEVLKYIIIICCVSLIGSVFYHNGLISDDLYTFYLSIVFAVGLIYVFYKLYDIYIRDDINFTRFAYEKLFTPYNNVNDFNSSEDCK